MTTLKYCRLGNQYLLTGFCSDNSPQVTFKLSPEKDGELEICGYRLSLKGGAARIEKSKITEGIHTPIFREKNGAAFVCEKLESKAGVIHDAQSSEDRSLAAINLLTAMNKKLLRLEKAFSELYEAVYGKTIF